MDLQRVLSITQAEVQKDHFVELEVEIVLVEVSTFQP